MWERLRDSLGPDDTLIANYRLTDEDKDYEADLVAVICNVGIVAIEVKGAGVGFDDGQWTVRRGGKQRVIDPVDQIRCFRYALRTFLESDSRWAESSRSRIKISHTVVTPFTELPENFYLADCPRWMVHDKTDLPQLAERIIDGALRQNPNNRPATDDDCRVAVDILTDRGITAEA